MIQVHVQVCLNKGTLSEIMLFWCIPGDTGICTGVFEFRYTIRDYQIVFSNAGVLIYLDFLTVIHCSTLSQT